MGLAAVSPVRGGFAVSIRGAFGCAFRTRACVGDGGTTRSVGCLWINGPLAVEGDVASVSAAVEVDMLLDDDSSVGAENVLDATETMDSCESGSSRW